VVFGNSNSDVSVNIDFRINYLGFLDSDESLSLAYSSCNVMVVPSIQESFGQTAMESMSCGTPVVSFDSTGLKDIVDHLTNGYLAECFCVKDLSKGINWVLDHESPDLLRKQARHKIEQKFDSTVVVNQFIELYKTVLKSS
jgi:glycosyltransferase involved in cell wall biosynthesis